MACGQLDKSEESITCIYQTMILEGPGDIFSYSTVPADRAGHGSQERQIRKRNRIHPVIGHREHNIENCKNAEHRSEYK